MSFIKKHKQLVLLCTLITVAVFAMFLPNLIQGKYFIGGGDVKTQWYPFYVLNRRTTINALKDHTLPFYSFILFLGNNIWASKSSYGLFDIYNLVTYVFKQDYFFIYDLQCLIKILVSGISSYLLIDYLYKDKKTSLIAGLCYSLSSFAIYFTSQPGFLSFYSLAPLYFLGMEYYLKEKKKYLFIIITFLLLLMNYYLFYAISLFSPIYFIYRYYNLYKNIYGLFKSAILLILYYLIGVLLSAVVIVPAFFYVTQNERIGGLYLLFNYEELSVYFHLFISAFVPSHDYIYGNNVFELGEHTLKEICLYAGTIICLLVPQFLSDKDRRYKYSTLILYLMFIFFAITPFTGSIINGFSEPCFRWLFIFIIINIITASKYINNFNRKNLFVTMILEFLLIFILFAAGLVYKNYLLKDYLIQLGILVVVSIFLLVNAFLLLKGQKYFVVSTFIELLLFTSFYGYKSSSIAVSKDDIDNVTSVIVENDDYHNLSNYLNSLDDKDEYYRVYVSYEDLYWSFSQNMGILYNINGLMTYDSTYAQSFNKMRRMNYDEIVDGMDWRFNIKDVNIMNFLSTKYSITLDKNEIPFNNYEIVDDSYVIIAKNMDYKPFGRTYTKTMKYKDFNNDTSLLNEYVICDTDVKVGNTVYDMVNVAYNDNSISGDIKTNEDSFVVLSLPYDEGWNIKVNGKEISYYECNGGMIGFNVESGDNHIEMEFIPKGFYLGSIMSCVGLISLVVLILIDKKVKYNCEDEQVV